MVIGLCFYLVLNNRWINYVVPVREKCIISQEKVYSSIVIFSFELFLYVVCSIYLSLLIISKTLDFFNLISRKNKNCRSLSTGRKGSDDRRNRSNDDADESPYMLDPFLKGIPAFGADARIEELALIRRE